MNPFWKISLAVSLITLVLNCFGLVYFFGFFRGSFEEFKSHTKESLKRLESVFFKDVHVVAKPAEATGDFSTRKERHEVA